MDGIIFDVDGTLWDSTEVVANAWNDVLNKHSEVDKRVTAAELKGQFGKPLDEIMCNVFPKLSGEEREVLSEELFRYENVEVAVKPCVLYEGMKETIKELSKRYPLFIVSNCEAGYIEAFLQNTGLGGYIKAHLCPGDTGQMKGDNIKLIMKQNGLHKAVYVGDTSGDANACREAGIPMIYAEYGFGEVKNPYRSIKCFRELLELDYDVLE